METTPIEVTNHLPQPPPAAASAGRVAAVIPCYRVCAHIVDLIRQIGPEVELVICVDDGCPDGSGRAVTEAFKSDHRVRVVRHDRNHGVGGAMITGYRTALELGAEIIVKLDGDGQMDPQLIPYFVAPIATGEADYVKGNRFFAIETVRSMPLRRLIGNAVLSFLTKLSSGYWDLFDPSNGFTAIAAGVARALPLEKLHRRYFFEADMLFRLGVVRARVIELPIVAQYGQESSNMNEAQVAATFPALHMKNACKRLFYSYFLRGFSIASVNLLVGGALFCFGIVFGANAWIETRGAGQVATAGTVMLAALPVLSGLQLLLAFLAHDMSTSPTTSIHRQLHLVTILSSQATKARR